MLPESTGPELSWLLLVLAAGLLALVAFYNDRERRRLPPVRHEPPAFTEPTQASELSPASGVAAEQPIFQEPYTAVMSLALGSGLALSPEAERRATSLVRAGSKTAAVRILRSESQALQGIEVGLVLANRLGPLSLPDYESWLAQVEGLRSQLGLRAAQLVPSFAELHARSREAERRLTACDGQMALHVLAPPPTDSALSLWAQGRGLKQRAERHFSRMANEDAVAYTFTSGDGGRAVSCVMDLPRTPQPEQAFEAMLEDLLNACEVFEGALVDESSRVLADEDLALIEHQLIERAQALREAGLEPGGWLARAVYV